MVLYPALDAAATDKGDNAEQDEEDTMPSSRSKWAPAKASFRATHSAAKDGEPEKGEVLGNLARNLQEQQRRKVLRTGRQQS